MKNAIENLKQQNISLDISLTFDAIESVLFMMYNLIR